MNTATLGGRMAALRQAAGLTQDRAADLIGVDSSYLCRIESGQNHNVGSTLLLAMAQTFGCSVDYLLVGGPFPPVEAIRSAVTLRTTIMKKPKRTRLDPAGDTPDAGGDPGEGAQ